jgi:hypothetical protein
MNNTTTSTLSTFSPIRLLVASKTTSGGPPVGRISTCSTEPCCQINFMGCLGPTYGVPPPDNYNKCCFGPGPYHEGQTCGQCMAPTPLPCKTPGSPPKPAGCSGCDYYNGDQKTGGYFCTHCAPGYEGALGNFWSTNTPCSGGAPSMCACEICPAGQMSQGGAATSTAAQCKPCAPGQYSAAPGSSSCTLCPAGSVTNASATQCIKCPAGTFSPDPAIPCAPCLPGSFLNSSQTSCTKCPAGQFSPEPNTTCAPCPAGQYSEAPGYSKCTLCSAGQYSPAGSSQCTFCPEGQFSPSPGSAMCSFCKAGHYSALKGASTCTSCGVGHYSASPGASTCAPCHAGSVVNSSQTSCTPCSKGHYSASLGSTTCSPCKPGTYNNAPGAKSCAKCPAGQVSQSPASQLCNPCPQDGSGPNKAQTECNCPPNTCRTEDWYGGTPCYKKGASCGVYVTNSPTNAEPGGGWCDCHEHGHCTCTSCNSQKLINSRNGQKCIDHIVSGIGVSGCYYSPETDSWPCS